MVCTRRVLTAVLPVKAAARPAPTGQGRHRVQGSTTTTAASTRATPTGPSAMHLPAGRQAASAAAACRGCRQQPARASTGSRPQCAARYPVRDDAADGPAAAALAGQAAGAPWAQARAARGCNCARGIWRAGPAVVHDRPAGGTPAVLACGRIEAVPPPFSGWRVGAVAIARGTAGRTISNWLPRADWRRALLRLPAVARRQCSPLCCRRRLVICCCLLAAWPVLLLLRLCEELTRHLRRQHCWPTCPPGCQGAAVATALAISQELLSSCCCCCVVPC